MKSILKLETNKYIIIITPIVLFLFLIINGILGIRFGFHWDEIIFIRQACESIKTGVFLPHQYIYPSFSYYIVLIAGEIYTSIHDIKDTATLIDNYEFYVFLRYIFLTISSLIVIWVYILTYKISKNYIVALFAGLIICSSFEFSYHSRWAVCDCIAVQFAFLSTTFLFLNFSRRKKIILSSIIAGFAIGTKYTAGIVCINILFFIISGIKENKRNFRTIFNEFFLVLFYTIIGFVITTPGAIYEHIKFMDDLKWQKNVYSQGHYGYTVKSGISHFIKIFEYYIFELFSKNSFISLLIFILAIVGIVFTAIKKEWLLFCTFITMIVYVIYVSSFKVMIVRNMLYVLPFFAIWCAYGLFTIIKKFQAIEAKLILGSFVLLFLFYSCSRVMKASLTIYNKENVNLIQELKSYIKQNRDKEFVFFPEVSSLLKIKHNPKIKPPKDSYLVFFNHEIPWRQYTANIRNQFEDVIGLDDVNLNYYPTWDGSDRIIIMKYANASQKIMFYYFNTIEILDKYKVVCDAETLTKDNYFFEPTEYLNDSIIKKNSFAFSGVDARNDEYAHSGKYSIKLDNIVHTGMKCYLNNINSDFVYSFSVWRKNPEHTGLLVVENKEKSLWISDTKVVQTDKNGWEQIQLNYFPPDNIRELSVVLWQPDTLSTVYFDDLTIIVYRNNEK